MVVERGASREAASALLVQIYSYVIENSKRNIRCFSATYTKSESLSMFMSFIRIASNSESMFACTEAGTFDCEDPILQFGINFSSYAD